MSQETESKLFFELGQMIKIYAPTLNDIHEKIYLIDYLDDNVIKLINDTDFSKLDLTIRDGKLTNESIEKISIIFTPTVKGYARQNNLVPTNWISIEFGGDIPTIINGQITDLDEDQIELTTYGTSKKIYIDFNYQGIPLDLPIISIKPFINPEIEEEKSKSLEEELIDTDDEDLELIIDTDEINENIQDLFIEADDIEVSDESLGEIVEKVRVKEEYKRFGIETQTQDILDEMLAQYPSNKRTKKVINNIHILIERFKELRRTFSNFNESGNAENIKKKGADYKPLVHKLKKLNQKLYWLIPVVRNMHKLIDVETVDTFDDADIMNFKWSANNLMDTFRQYYNNNIPDGQNKYNYLNQNINPFFTPFKETNNKENIIIQKAVETNLDILSDNFDNLYSIMYGVNNNRLFSCIPFKESGGDGDIRSKQYVIDRYNLGLKKLYNPDIKNKYSKAVVVPLTNNDPVDLLGFVSLQKPYITYSHINLPKTSIYDKANLEKFNYYYYKIFSDIDIFTKTIKEGEEPKELTDAEKFFYKSDKDDVWGKEARKEYKKIIKEIGFNYPHYFNFEENRKFVDRESLQVSNNVYEDFLNVMIPKTRILFEMIKNNIKNGTSYLKIIEYLEPFLIYEDDISYKQYEIITDFIFEQIKEHKTLLNKNNDMFLKFIRENKSYFVSTILPKLVKNDNKYLFDKAYYNVNDSIDTEQSIKKIIDYDSGRVFNLALSLSELTFSQPIDIEDKVDTEMKLTEQNIEDGEPLSNKECGKKYTLVKKYLDIDDLTEDNNSPVFVDKKYDETPYDIGEEWKRNNSVLVASSDDDKLVIEELSKFLMENNGLEEGKAKVDAAAMILGSREVQEGDYAILDIGGDIKYYVRQDNIWKYDKTLSGKHIDEVNFCNLKENCLKIKDTCTNLDSSKEKLKKNILGEIAERFENELQLSIEDLKSKIIKELNYRKVNLQSLKAYKIQKLLKRDLFQTKIADTLEEREIAVSPYETLRDEILSQIDIVKKYNDIDTFIEQYCREATDDEDGYWYYCTDTDVKLLPTFFQELANGFFEEEYLITLEKIYKERGEKSDDGDKWVDKYSGYYISEIQFDYAEGYDANGFKIKSREVMEESKADKMKQSKLRDTKQEYSTTLAKHIEHILITFDDKLHISTKSQYNFVIKTVMESINLNAPDEDNYRELYEQAIKKGKRPKTYEKKYDEILFYSLISAYMIAVQSTIPGIIAKKAFGDCKKSFSGFPIDGNSDLTFMEYFSCMVFNLRRDDRPWNILPKALTKSKNRRKNYEDVKIKFIETVKKFMEEKILIVDEVKQLLNLKREWLKHNKTGEIIPTEFNVQQWTSFLPPLNPVAVTRVNNIAHTFEKTLRTRMEEGSYQQFSHLWALYGKIVTYSFSIIESVQRAINKEPLLLETKGGIPYLENACCNNGEPKTSLYFSQKESSIKKHNEIIKSLTDLYYKYKNSNKPVLFNVPIDTKLKYLPISDDFSKDTIYLAFIKYCKFNSGIILEDALKRVCGNNNCNFKSTEPLKDKILAMEADDLNYSKESLNILLNIINRENILHYDIDPPVTTEKLFLEHTLEKLKMKMEDKNRPFLCHSKLLDYLDKIVDRFDVSIQGEDDPIVLEFTAYLKDINRQMAVKISKKMNERGELTNKLKDVLIQYTPEDSIGEKKAKLKKEQFILNWDIRGDNVYMTQEDETGFTIFRMLKEMTINICKVFPTMILNNRIKRYVPQHWLKGSKKLSERHGMEIQGFMKKDTDDIMKFHNDEEIKAVLRHVLKNNKDLLMLLDSIPFYAGILRDRIETGSIFDGEILKQMGYYFMLCSFILYMTAFEEKGLKIDINQDDEEEEDISILLGEQEALEKKTCNLLLVYLQKIKNYKDLLNVSTETINNRVLKTKTKEKEALVKRIGKLLPDEREIENLMKNNSLGEWSVGKTKAIFEYDNKQYDKEREQMERDAILEKRAGGLDDVSEFIGEIYNISEVVDTLEQDDITRRIEAEVYNLDGLAEDDDFGERDGDNQGDYN